MERAKAVVWGAPGAAVQPPPGVVESPPAVWCSEPAEAQAGRGKPGGAGGGAGWAGAGRERRHDGEDGKGRPHRTGKRIVIRVPSCPSGVSTSMTPSCIWTMRYTRESPMPLPSGLVV